MNKNTKRALREIAGAMSDVGESAKQSADTIGDLVNTLLTEPNAKKRKRLIDDFTARHTDAADFLAANDNLVNSEAEAALIKAAVGGVFEEREISFKGGRKSVSIKRRNVPPNMQALAMLLKNRMPDKYTDKPLGTVEIEDTSEVEEMIDNADESTADEGG